MKTKAVYFIAYYGTKHMVWDDDGKRFVPAGMNLYRSTYEKIDDAIAVYKKVRRACSGWHDDIYIDSELTIA